MIMVFISAGLPQGSFMMWFGFLFVGFMIWRIRSIETSVRGDSVLVRNLWGGRREIPIDQVEGVNWRPFPLLTSLGTAGLVLCDGSWMRLDAAVGKTDAVEPLVDGLVKALEGGVKVGEPAAADSSDRVHERMDEIRLYRARSLAVVFIGGVGLVALILVADAFSDPSPSLLLTVGSLVLILVPIVLLGSGLRMVLTGWGIRFRSKSIFNGTSLVLPLSVEWKKIKEFRVVGRGLLERVVIDGGPFHRKHAFVWLLRGLPSQNRAEWLAQRLSDERTRRMAPPSP